MSEPRDADDADDDVGSLDERMRARLADVAAGAEPALDEAARARVIAAAVSAGREGARRRRWAQRGTVALVVACAAAVLLWWWPRAEEPAPPLVARACASWDAAGSGPLAPGAPTSMGRRGTLGLSADGQASIGGGPCATEVVLVAGAVAVQADDLGGGDLTIRAGDVRVRVTGTRFSVGRENGGILVAVAEGTVAVSGPLEGAPVRLEAGRSWRSDGTSSIIGSLDAAQRHDIDALLAPSPEPELAADDVPPPTPPASDLEDAATDDEPREDPGALALEAEAHYRRGDLASARAGFRRAARHSESAAVRWARLELEARALEAAREALALHAHRHRGGRLSAEAAYIGLEVLEAAGDRDGARRAAEAIVSRFPGTTQALAAARRL